MRILIYGAGVIGSLYAVLFAETGYDTSIYARGKRLEFLKKNGLLYKKNQHMIFFSKNSHIKHGCGCHMLKNLERDTDF